MTYLPELPFGNGNRFPSREEILKAILAAGMLSNQNMHPETIKNRKDSLDLSIFADSVNDVYTALFEEGNNR